MIAETALSPLVRIKNLERSPQLVIWEIAFQKRRRRSAETLKEYRRAQAQAQEQVRRTVLF